MEIIGNIDLLKDQIEKSYLEKLKNFQNEKLAEYNEEIKKITETFDKEVKKTNLNLLEKKKKVFRTTLADEKLNAKKSFEKKRESIINDVFQKVQDRSKDFLLSEEYLQKVESFINNNEILLRGSFEEYKHRFPDMVIDPSIQGIIVEEGTKIFDFTFSTFVESRNLDLRHKVSSILFQK